MVAPLPPPTPLSPDGDLIAQGRMLRGLAGHLVVDPATADDAVQEAWLAALKRRPDADRPLEPWLKRVVRNVVARFKRDRVRSARRERLVARPEAAPDAHALAERAQLLRTLLDEALALPDLEREVVLLRYYEGLPPRTIAERLGAPVEVIYRRLEHALERLRARLDARHGGVRRTWSLGLVAALGVPRELLAPATAAASGAVAGATVATSAPLTVPVTLVGATVMASTASTVTVGAVLLGLGLGGGWFAHQSLGSDVGGAGSSGGASTREGTDTVATPPPPDAPPRLEASEGSRREALLRDEAQSLRQQLATVKAELEAVVKAQSEAAKPLDPKALRFGLSGATPVFDKADWKDLSEHMTAMIQAMPKLRENLNKGEGPSPEIVQALQEHNTPLAIFAVSTAAELKGTGPNGAYTHPAVIANLMRAALIAAGEPLSNAQEQALVTLGNVWASEHERQLKSFAADTPAIAVTIAEVDAKDRFLQAAKAQLTSTQRAVLFHPDTEDRLGMDLLSPALVYMLHADGGVTNPELLPAKALSLLLAGTGLKAEEQSAYLRVGEQWVGETPVGTVPQDPRAPDTSMPRLGTLQAFARAQLGATQRVLDGGRLTPEQAARLRKQTTLVIPYVLRTP